jgi:3-oxosteroid 1-dehydrogenase
MLPGYDAEYDLIVIGAGAAGMTAALVAAIEGLRVLLLEHAAQVGGTSARSSGTLWIPRDTAAATVYLDALVGNKAERPLREAFLAHGPAMLGYLEQHAGFSFRPYPHHPDYRQNLRGAVLAGRALESPPFDGRLLGPRFAEVAWPLRELMLLGGMMVTRGEAARLVEAWKSPSSLMLGARLVARYAADRLRYRRGTRLVLGNALVARLYKNLLEREVTVWLSTGTRALIGERRAESGAAPVSGVPVSGATVSGATVSGATVSGATVERAGAAVRVKARFGVVLAGGGFPAAAAWRERWLPPPIPRHTPAAEGCAGETLRLGLEAGGALGPRGLDNALWFPGSIGARPDGTVAVYPHIVLDRAKPGLIAVGAAGARFTDEAASYHEFTRAMYHTSTIPAWLVCDRRFLRRYGLGMVRPMALGVARHVASGYLRRAGSVAELARNIGVDPAGLEASVRRHNEFARSGIDGDFAKGGNAYDQAHGDPSHRPNPCLGPIDAPPFYAVRVEPVPLGTSLGLATDEHARVRDAAGRLVGGLYAVGNDMHSPMGGEYPGAGAQLGPGMTFGYLAALHAAAARSQAQRNALAAHA